MGYSGWLTDDGPPSYLMSCFFTPFGYYLAGHFLHVFKHSFYTRDDCVRCCGVCSSEDQDEKGKSIWYKMITINFY